MKILRFPMFYVPFITALSLISRIQAGQGCCSSHGGIDGCLGSKLLCNDGTFSPTCNCRDSTPIPVARSYPERAKHDSVSPEKQKKRIGVAEGYLGTTYKSGGYDKRGMDCSGLTQKTSPEYFGQIGPNGEGKLNARQQLDLLEKRGDEDIPRDELDPADLLYFQDNKGAIIHSAIVKRLDKKRGVNIITASSGKFRAVTNKEWLDSEGNLGSRLHFSGGGRPEVR